jgi:hypothetical protein
MEPATSRAKREKIKTKTKAKRKKVYFSPGIDKYFAHWILQRTWNSGHINDDSRFYQFATALFKYGKRRYSNDNIRERILTAVKNNHPNHWNQDAKRGAEKKTKLALLIREYLRATRGIYCVPSLWIEQWEPDLK